MSCLHPSGRRRALTLMQLLVLLALLLALLGFFLAAAVRVRSVAERTESQNSLRQIVLGSINAADTLGGSLPPGPANWYPQGKGALANGGYGPCLFHILPYVEQLPLYNSTSKNVDGKQVHVSWGAAGTSVKLYLADGDPTFEKGSDRTNYLANELALPEKPAKYPVSFTDGTSNTILFAEGYSQASDTVTFGGQTTAWRTDRHWWDNPTWKPVPGAVMFQVAPPRDAASSFLPQGFTPAGINVGLADGSVRTVSGTVSSATFYAACTPAGNDLLGSDW